MGNMGEILAKMEELKKNKETLMGWVSNELSNGCQGFDLKGTGEAVDMIKDLACAEKDCWESLYYQTVVEAMLERSGEDDMRMGYNNRRMANGRYAPAGEGRIYGYRPYLDQEPYIDSYLHDENFRDRMSDRMGYRGEGSQSNSNMSSGNRNTYDNYRMAKRHYTETGSKSDKEQMEAHQMKYINEAVDHLREIWDDAEPMPKKRIKEDLKELLDNMT